MTILNRFYAFRRYFGWADISEERLSPAHGWLLPTPSELHTLPADPGSTKDGAEPAAHGGPHLLSI